MTALPKAARIYVCAVVAAGLLAGGFALPQLEHVRAVVALAALSILCASVSEVPDGSGSLSLSLGFVVAIAAVFITGTGGAVVVAAAGAFHYVKGGQPLIKRAFNAAQYALSGGASALVYVSLHGPVSRLAPDDFPGVITVLVAVVVTYSVVNHGLVTGILAIARPRSLRPAWWQVIPWASSPYLAYGFLSLLMAALWENVGPPTATLLLIPLVITRTTFANFIEQQKAYDATVAALIQAVETKDHYTRGHSERVSGGSVLIARQLRMGDDKVKALHYAGMLHDVGKMGVPTRVLQKQGRLTMPEVDAVKSHPARGCRCWGTSTFLQEALSGIYHHHERMDGKGYPLGLKGMDIPEFARVIMVADAFDSMTSNRSYRPAMSIEAAIDELVACSGVQFDPAMVEAMVAALHEHGWRVQGADHARLPTLPPVSSGGRPETREVPLPRAVAAYSSVETDS